MATSHIRSTSELPSLRSRPLGGRLRLSPDASRRRHPRRGAVGTTWRRLVPAGTFVLLLTFWSGLAALVIWLAGLHPLSLLVLIYPAVPLALLLREGLSVDRVYWYLPYVNTSLGGLVFLLATLRTVAW